MAESDPLAIIQDFLGGKPNEKALDGIVGEKEEIKLLKFGSIQLEVGERYIVSLDNHKICQITPESEATLAD